MSFTMGVVLFAVALGISIALHEFGHLLTAKMFGMKATQYFIGFGPTLWSFRRGETEYGFKAIPAGGYVRITGMTHLEEVAQSDDARAFWRYPAWKRVIVMSAGSVTHFLLALFCIYLAATTVGLPTDRAKVGEVQSCVVAQGNKDGTIRDCRSDDLAAPGQQAGLRTGDEIVALNGTAVDGFTDMVEKIRDMPGERVTVTYVRDGKRQDTSLTVAEVHRVPIEGEKAEEDTGLATVGAIGISGDLTERYGPVAAVGQTFDASGRMLQSVFSALKQFPEKIPRLFDALAGEERDPNTPVSVVGASRIGGQALAAESWLTFLVLLAGFNVFIGVFNLFPLLPLDGGHIAILLYEKARSRIARALGRADPGRVDLNKLIPLTLLVIVLFGGLSLLTILADVVNPIDNPFQ